MMLDSTYSLLVLRAPRCRCFLVSLHMQVERELVRPEQAASNICECAECQGS